MSRPAHVRLVAIFAAVAIAVLAFGVASGSGRGTGGHCGAFEAQADAEEYFIAAGGTPHHDVSRLDPDHDGVACPQLGAPYIGYATIGYNNKRNFFYGTAKMPPGIEEAEAGAEPKVPCLTGDSHYPNDARQVKIFRLIGDLRHPVFSRTFGVEARPSSRRLLWKAPAAKVKPGRYVAYFEEKIRNSPYGRSECPAFESRAVQLPAVRHKGAQKAGSE